MAEQPFNFGDTPPSPLELAAIQYRNTELAINHFSSDNPYGINNPDAISPKGEGQNFYGSIGTSKDIQTRNETMARNRSVSYTHLTMPTKRIV